MREGGRRRAGAPGGVPRQAAGQGRPRGRRRSVAGGCPAGEGVGRGACSRRGARGKRRRRLGDARAGGSGSVAGPASRPSARGGSGRHGSLPAGTAFHSSLKLLTAFCPPERRASRSPRLVGWRGAALEPGALVPPRLLG